VPIVSAHFRSLLRTGSRKLLATPLVAASIAGGQQAPTERLRGWPSRPPPPPPAQFISFSYAISRLTGALAPFPELSHSALRPHGDEPTSRLRQTNQFFRIHVGRYYNAMLLLSTLDDWRIHRVTVT